MNSIPVSLKNRPRIPTPDVTKEVVDREQRLALSASNAANIGAGVVGVMHQLPANGHYPDLPVVQVVLSPIQETEGSPTGGKPGTAALAQAVLSPTLTSAGLVAPVTLTPVTVSQLTQLGFVTTTSSPMRDSHGQPSIQATLTEVNTSEEESGSSRSGSINGHEDRSTPLIGELRSPLTSHGSSPVFDSYSDRSPILMSPEKLSGYIVTEVVDGRGRRSASLSGPPVPQPREDRSMSLPHSPGLHHRDNRIPHSYGTQVSPVAADRLLPVQTEVRHRAGSFSREPPKPPPELPRKTSTGSNRESNSTTNSGATTAVPGSKRGEVYV